MYTNKFKEIFYLDEIILTRESDDYINVSNILKKYNLSKNNIMNKSLEQWFNSDFAKYQIEVITSRLNNSINLMDSIENVSNESSLADEYKIKPFYYQPHINGNRISELNVQKDTCIEGIYINKYLLPCFLCWMDYSYYDKLVSQYTDIASEINYSIDNIDNKVNKFDLLNNVSKSLDEEYKLMLPKIEVKLLNESGWVALLIEYASKMNEVYTDEIEFEFQAKIIKPYRIDAFARINNNLYFLEFDENDHSRYDVFKELVRYKQIYKYYKKLKENNSDAKLFILRFSDSYYYDLEYIKEVFTYSHQLTDDVNLIYIEYKIPLNISKVLDEYSVHVYN